MVVKFKIKFSEISSFDEKHLCPYGDVFLEIDNKPFHVGEKSGQIFPVISPYILDVGYFMDNIPKILSEKKVELSVLDGSILEIRNLNGEIELILYAPNEKDIWARKKADKLEFVKAIIESSGDILKACIEKNKKLKEIKNIQKEIEKAKETVKKFEAKNK